MNLKMEPRLGNSPEEITKFGRVVSFVTIFNNEPTKQETVHGSNVVLIVLL